MGFGYLDDNEIWHEVGQNTIKQSNKMRDVIEMDSVLETNIISRTHLQLPEKIRIQVRKVALVRISLNIVSDFLISTHHWSDRVNYRGPRGRSPLQKSSSL